MLCEYKYAIQYKILMGEILMNFQQFVDISLLKFSIWLAT